MKKVEELRALSTPTPEAPAPEGGAEKAREIASSAAEAFQRLMVSTKFDRETRELWAGAYNDMVAIYSALAAREEAPAEWFGVTGAVDETEALAVALFAVRCPGVRMTDEDLHHYRSAAQRAMQVVSAELSGNPGQLDAPAEAGETDWSRFKQMCEEKLSVAIKADHGDAPFPMDASEAASYHRTRAELLGWVLDMWPTAPITALRAQPPAREDAQPVGEIVLSNKFGSGVSWLDGKLPPLGSKLYTRPAPDALRVALSDAMVEAACSRFVSESDDIWSASVWPEGPDDDGDRGDGGRVRLISEADQHNIRSAMRFAMTDALAALQAEQKGGSPGGQEA